MLGRRAGGRADSLSVVILSKRSAARGPKLILSTKLIGAIRKIAGMPDYQTYLAHVQHCHPEAAPLSEREFYDDFVRARYGDGPTRCC